MKLIVLIFIVFLSAGAGAETWNGRVQLTAGGRGCPELPYKTGEYPLIMTDSVEGNAWSAKFESDFLKGTATGTVLGGNRHAAGLFKDGWSVNLYPDPAGGIKINARLDTVASTCSVAAQGILKRGNPNVNLAGFWSMKQFSTSTNMELFGIMIAPDDPGLWVGDINVAQFFKHGKRSELPHERVKGSFAGGMYGKTGWKITVVWLDEASKKMRVALERPGYKEFLTLDYLGAGYL